MSPILVRPVREQLEHDRVIRLLQAKLKKRPGGNDVIANIGDDQSTSVKIGPLQIFPDLILASADRARKLIGTVEVETSESVNHLEARSQWAHLGRARAPFHLYVPMGSVDIARRLAAENHVHVSELWSFHTIGDQTHFRLVHRTPDDTRRSNEPRGIVTIARPEPPKSVPPPSPPPAPVKAVEPAKAGAPAPKIQKGVAARPTPPARPASPAKKAAAPSKAAVKKRPAPPVRKAKPAAKKAAVRAQKRK